MQRPHDLIVVEGIEDKNIVVKLAAGEIVITISDQSLKYSADKFRCFAFMGCERCDVYILVKTTKILFAFCDELKISIRKDALATLEVYKCAKLDIVNMAKVPICTVEESDQVNFFQDASPQKYMVLASDARAIASLSVGTPASSLNDLHHNISNMFGDQKIFTVSSEEYSTTIYENPFQKRLVPGERSQSLPIMKTGKDFF